MTDTTLSTNWASINARDDAAVAKRPARRGFAIGLVIALPVAGLAWALLFSLI